MTEGGSILASHTLQTAGAAVAVELSIDVPSALTGTGDALLLDGHDTGLVRATIVDAAGLIVDADHLVTFAIESGRTFTSNLPEIAPAARYCSPN